MPPDPFLGIRLRGIAWELLEVNPARRTGTEKLLDLAAPMDGCTVPDHEQLARDVAQEVAEECYDVPAPDRMSVYPEVEPLVVRFIAWFIAWFIASSSPAADGAYYGEMIVRQPVVENGGLAHRGIGASDGGQEIEPALIDEEQCPALSEGLFFLGPASARLSTAGWPPRRAAWRAAPASGSSSPTVPAICSRAPDGT